MREDEWESREFKVMCYVVSVSEPKGLAKRLHSFARRVLSAEFYSWTYIYKSAVETEQISRDEISPARLYRGYAEIDDEEVYAEDLY